MPAKPFAVWCFIAVYLIAACEPEPDVESGGSRGTDQAPVTGGSIGATGLGADGGASGDRGDASTDRAPSQQGAAGGAGSGNSVGPGDAGSADGGQAMSGAALPSGVRYMFPPPQGEGVCPDAPLRIRFDGPPALGTSGKIQVYDQAGHVVAALDMAVANVRDTIGGTTFNLPRRAFVDGDAAVFYLKTKALAYGQSYYVTVDDGVIRPPHGSFSLTGETAWRFTTARAAPANLGVLKVALDGAGSFCSVQGALDALPANNTKPALITIEPGTYHEVVHMRGKSNVTLRGVDRKQTVIAGTNNDDLNPGTATRALVGFDATNGLVVENLTIHNLTPQDGSQAEALRLQGCDECVVKNADILSLQDTLLWSGRIYASNCYVAGNVDYVWGTGVVYFDKCEFHTVGRTGVVVQARNAPGAYGYVFVDSKLSADAAAKNNILARIDVSAYPGSHVAFIGCELQNVAAAGWTITGGAVSSALRFWEYQSHDAAGNALGASGRADGSARISSEQAALMRDPAVVLGGWQPPR